MSESFHIEVYHEEKPHEGERICGDRFVSRRVGEEGRIVAVLSDGLGHGVKANILATLTSSMALNFTIEHKDPVRIAEVIMNTLPVDDERKISYATFTIVDIEINGDVSILEYDNPQAIVMRGHELFMPQWQCIIMEGENRGKELRYCRFKPQKEDRIIFSSDGVTQSGLGTDAYPLGWGEDNLRRFVAETIGNQPDISADKLCQRLITKAAKNDGYASKDDTSCAVIYFRKPRRLLICTGPPFKKEKDKELAREVRDFKGKKIISGATTADIISRELKLEIEDGFEFEDPDLPPVSYMEGIDLLTEGILTLSKVAELLKVYDHKTRLRKGPADQIVQMLRESDEVNFIIGTRINIAHQDPNLPVELEIRRTVVKRIAALLQDKFFKDVNIKYI
ncbi:MAG: SpoIIE family protein phosphatase [Bacteroidales bacterium]